jgi:hypothetical protein
LTARRRGRDVAIVAGAILLLPSLGCDPVRTGTYQGYFQAPVSVRSLRYEADPASTITAANLSGPLYMRVQRYRESRRWFDDGLVVPVGAWNGGPSLMFELPSLWKNLSAPLDSYAQTPEEALENMQYGGAPAAAFGSVWGVADYLFVVATQDLAVQPVGASGPWVSIKRGLQILHRSCTADERNHFEEVPLDTTVTFDPAIFLNQDELDPDPFFHRCGLATIPPADLGDIVAMFPSDPFGGTAPPVTDFAWSPGSDAVYMLAGTLGSNDVELQRVKVGEMGATQLAFGDFYGPLEVATGGSSVLFNQAGSEVRQSFVGDQALSPVRIPVYAAPPFGGPSGILSPDGATFAVVATAYSIDLIDLAKATVSVSDVGSGYPLAWEPSGQSLLVRTDEETLSSLSLDGSVKAFQGVKDGAFLPRDLTTDPGRTTSVRYLWTASGPQLVTQGRDGAEVYNIATGVKTELVEANRVAPPLAPVGVVVATDQVFAWAPRCYGLAETWCDAELRRLSLATGIRDIVAHADRVLPFAVSPDGTKIAFADSKNVYIKTLSPATP